MALLAAGALAVPAAAAAHSFSGSCEISGPITPRPGITLLPLPGAHFSFHGTGRCQGSVGGRPKRTRKARLDFVNVTTLFDTCELGPDVGLHGRLTIARSPGRLARFPITLNLLRAAIAGPFVLRADGGGLAIGVARFSPNDPQQAALQCAGIRGGLREAHLTATMQTVTPLIG